MKESRRPGRPKLDTAEVPTSERILEVASKLFMELGYDGVTTDDVASQTGVTKAMIYYYYSSKSELFTASILRMMRNIAQRTRNILDEPLSLYDRLLKIAVIRLSITGIRHDFESILRNTEHALTHEQLMQIEVAEHQLMGVLADAFAISVKKGELRPVNPSTMSYLYVHSLAALEHQSQRTENEIEPRQLAEEILDILFHGVST